MAPKKLMLQDIQKAFPQDTIIYTDYQKSINYETLVEHLSNARVVYVGEQHSDSNHHNIQLKIIQSLYRLHPDLCVGMEMFDKSYQPILDQWANEQMDESEFLKKNHWYANWRYPFALYREILIFISENNIPLIGLNIPFHIPSKIAIGGVENLLDHDKRFLPDTIDTSIEAHRSYIEKVFGKHQLKGRDNFETFYEAQCVWEDTMAEVVAEHSKDRPIIVLAGNSHIIFDFGIPDRAFRRNPLPFKTIYLAPAGTSAKLGYADFIWVTPEIKTFHGMPVSDNG